MVHVSFIGRLGNNLIQYSLARFLAEQKGYELLYDTIGHTNAKEMFSLFPNTRTHIQGVNTLNNPITVGYDGLLDEVQCYDINTLLSHDGCISLKGFFQKHKLLMEHRDAILKYFEYDSTDLKSGQVFDVVIHIRLGDYVKLNHFIQPKKIYQLYKELGFKNALVLSDDIANTLLADFHNDPACTVQCNTPIQDIHYLATCSNVIISQSTFSWWGSYFGVDKEIYIPYDSNLNYPWPLEPEDIDVDLIPNQKNYHKIIV